ncbi:MAG: mannose-1-phosphate guanyltransferase, partial [Actinomycetota bacterium]
EAHRAVLDRTVDVEVEGFEVKPGVWLGEGAELDPDAEVSGPAFIGENARVEAGAALREHTVLGRGVSVRSGAFLHRCVVHDYVYVGPAASLRGCVVGKNSDIKFGAKLEEGVVVADECVIGDGAVLNPQVKVYPFKSVDPGAIVSKSIVWQSGGPRGLFGERGVSGLVNVDITPEMALRMALAYASLLPKRSVVVASRDPTRSARIVKRSMVAGINAGGVDCHDLELVPAPVAKFYARSAMATGGFSVRTTPGDPDSVDIQFFDERGIDVGPGIQRQLERSYYRDDLRRVFHHDIGELNFPARGRDYYARGMFDAVDTDALRNREAKLVVDYGFGAASLTGPLVLGRIRGEILAVNALLDEERLVHTREQAQEHLQALARLVRSSGAELGALIDATGERLHLVDGAGRILDGRTALLAFVSLVASTQPGANVALSVATSRVAEAIVRERGGQVVWSPISPASLMAAADRKGIAFAGDEGGGYVFPAFLPAYDGVMALLKLLEYLGATGTSLSDVVDGLPPAHIVRQDVAMPWETKGTVMRRLIERLDGERVVTIDGVKAYRDQDWVLVVPHPQEPVVRVWA